MMQDLDMVLTENKIQYFMDGGSVLGIMRHKGIIPWDDDIDIGLLTEDYIKFIDTGIKKLLDMGYDIESHVNDNASMLKLFIKGKWEKIGDKIIGTPTIDIFEYEEKDNRIQLLEPAFRLQWPHAYYNKSELYPLTKYKFGPLDVYAAKDCKSYCNRFYGKWKKQAIIHVRNPTTDGVNKKKTVMIPYKDLKKIKCYEIILKDLIKFKPEKEKIGAFYDKTGIIIKMKETIEKETKEKDKT
jgi:phosphorylcholine metabolism protein LicD